MAPRFPEILNVGPSNLFPKRKEHGERTKGKKTRKIMSSGWTHED